MLPEALAGAPDETKGKIARAFFDRLDKAVLYEALLAEEGRVCVFCERKIRAEDGKGQPIRGRVATGVDAAHWDPINPTHPTTGRIDPKPERALRWGNLYASCRIPDSCNAAQRNIELGFGPPSDVHLERWVRCNFAGVLEVTEACPEHLRPAVTHALNHTLGLNHDELKRARHAALAAIKRQYQRDGLDRAAGRQLALQLLQKADRPAYISVLVYELAREPLDAPIVAA